MQLATRKSDESDVYRHYCYYTRDTVMRLLRQEDPEGVAQRQARRLRRRSYNGKVIIEVQML